jgi:LysR family transcriptional regulator, glycine cleavage system transcriptional activator
VGMAERTLPLRGISVFEAAARRASFIAAAEELNLTPSAVSHQIRLLEEILGVRLFDRIGRGVTLTPQGAEYARSVGQSIRRLRLATNEVKARGKSGGASDVVRIETPPSFAYCWLLPRLPAFIAKHARIEIRVNAQGAPLQGDRLPWAPPAEAPADLQIVYGDDKLWKDRATLLLSEVVRPLCAPALLEQHPVKAPEHLLQRTLIGSQNHLSWEEWLGLQGVDLYESPVTLMQLDPSHLAIEAAVMGLGVILESSILVAAEMSAGTLVCPLPDLSCPGLSYWILTAAPATPGSALAAVIEWLREEAA